MIGYVSSTTHGTPQPQTRHAQSSLREKGLLYASDVISLPMLQAMQQRDKTFVDTKAFIADVAASANPLPDSLADKVCSLICLQCLCF